MSDPTDSASPAYLTTREVAELLRVKERKVYDLAAAGEIPHRRITGKLLFPSAELSAWIEGESQGAGHSGAGPGPSRTVPAERPAVVAGSHDPLLDWALRESGSGLATLFDGSMDGLARFGRGEAAVAGLHLPEADGWNVATVSSHGLTGCVLLGLARRTQGLILSASAAREVRGLADLAGRRVALRQEGAGSRVLFDRLAAEAGLEPRTACEEVSTVRTETAAAEAVAAGEAEAALGLMAAARSYRLDFVPLVQERFDLLIDRRAYFTQPIQRLMRFLDGPDLHARAAALGGYDLSDLGEVRWLSP